jgi:hypothetical protein
VFTPTKHGEFEAGTRIRPPGEPVNLDPKILPCTQLCRAGQGAWLRSFSGKSEGEGRDGEADLGL